MEPHQNILNMKKTGIYRKALLLATLLITFLLITSCGFKQKAQDAKDFAEAQIKAKINEIKEEKDAQFLANAAGINLDQIQLGQLAQRKGRTRHVKELGMMMEVAHTTSLKDLRVLANSKMIIIPTSPSDNAQKTYNKLMGKSKKDFDKAYTDIMVSEHENAIEAFEYASINSHDADIKSWATATLPHLRTHRDNSIVCLKKCKRS